MAKVCLEHLPSLDSLHSTTNTPGNHHAQRKPPRPTHTYTNFTHSLPTPTATENTLAVCLLLLLHLHCTAQSWLGSISPVSLPPHHHHNRRHRYLNCSISRCQANRHPSRHLVNLNHFRLLRVVGRGAFGKVRIVERKDTNLSFALKYIRKDEGTHRLTTPSTSTRLPNPNAIHNLDAISSILIPGS